MMTRALRANAPLSVDLCPQWNLDQIRDRLNRPRGKSSLSNHIRKTLKLTPVKIALLNEWGRPLPEDLATLIKSLPIPYLGLALLDQAISTAGGLRFESLTPDLMLKDRPGVFAAGEMLDWDAVTGGYLISGALALGHHAGGKAAHWVQNHGEMPDIETGF
jgi:predicted flavoprotein YhiN